MEPEKEPHGLSPQQAWQILQDDPRAVLVDIRSSPSLHSRGAVVKQVSAGFGLLGATVEGVPGDLSHLSTLCVDECHAPDLVFL